MNYFLAYWMFGILVQAVAIYLAQGREGITQTAFGLWEGRWSFWLGLFAGLFAGALIWPICLTLGLIVRYGKAHD